jgi:hypothetical protein
MPANAMDLRFLLTLIVFLGGVWMYLYKLISGLTVTDPAAPVLLTLGVMHYIVLVYLALSLVIFYVAGTSTGNSPPPTPWLSLSNTIVFKTWPVAVVALILSFLTAKLGSETNSPWVSPFFVLAAIFSFYKFWNAKAAPANAASWMEMGVFFLSVPIVAVPYFLFMGVALADVQIQTNKQFYEPNDVIQVSLRAAGYMFRPQLSSISCGAFHRDIDRDVMLAIPPEERGHTGGLLSVRFRSQGIPLRKTRHQQLNIVED